MGTTNVDLSEVFVAKPGTTSENCYYVTDGSFSLTTASYEKDAGVFQKTSATDGLSSVP